MEISGQHRFSAPRERVWELLLDPKILQQCLPGAEDLGNMFQFKHEFNEMYCGARDLNFARSINPELQTFADWLAQNKDRISLE